MKNIYLLFIASASLFICSVAFASLPIEISEEMEMNDTLAPFVKYTFTSDCDVDVDENMICNLTGELLHFEKVNQAINMSLVKIADLNRGIYLIKLYIICG